MTKVGYKDIQYTFSKGRKFFHPERIKTKFGYPNNDIELGVIIGFFWGKFGPNGYVEEDEFVEALEEHHLDLLVSAVKAVYKEERRRKNVS